MAKKHAAHETADPHPHPGTGGGQHSAADLVARKAQLDADAPYRMYVLRRLGLDVLQVNARSVSEAVMKINLTEEREFWVKSQTETSVVLVSTRSITKGVSTPEGDEYEHQDEYTLELKHA